MGSSASRLSKNYNMHYIPESLYESAKGKLSFS